MDHASVLDAGSRWARSKMHSDTWYGVIASTVPPFCNSINVSPVHRKKRPPAFTHWYIYWEFYQSLTVSMSGGIGMASE